MLIYNNKPIQAIEVEKAETFNPPRAFVVHRNGVWFEQRIVCVLSSEGGAIGVDINGERFDEIYEILDWNLSLFFQYLNEGWPGNFTTNGKVIRNVFGVPIADEEGILYHVSDQRSSNFTYSQLKIIDIDSHVNFWMTAEQTNIQDVAATPMEALYSLLNSKYPGEFTTDAPIESATVIKNKHGYVIANQNFVFFYDGAYKYGDFTPTDIEEASQYLRNTTKGEAVTQSSGTWNKRYLVCWRAFYGYSCTKMDTLVHYDFTNKDLCDFKKEILLPITKERAGCKNEFNAKITITSICEV